MIYILMWLPFVRQIASDFAQLHKHLFRQLSAATGQRDLFYCRVTYFQYLFVNQYCWAADIFVTAEFPCIAQLNVSYDKCFQSLDPLSKADKTNKGYSYHLHLKQKNKLPLLTINYYPGSVLKTPTGRRQTSWLFTNIANELNSGLPRDSSYVRQWSSLAL